MPPGTKEAEFEQCEGIGSASTIWDCKELVALGAQADIETEANEWAALWEEYQEYEVAVRVCDADKPERITAELLAAAARTFPPDTGLGCDNMSPRAILRLSPAALETLADILTQLESEGRWAEDMDLVLIVLLAKPCGGRRPIGLMPTTVRLWSRVRSLQAK